MWRIPLAIPVGFTSLLPVWWPVAFSLGDHLIFWGAGHSILVGGSPYDRTPWILLAASYPSPHLEFLTRSGDEIWLYPPWTALLFAPFGALRLDAGLWAIHASYVAASLASVAMLIDMSSWRTVKGRTLAALLAITFQPLVIAARWGQFTSWTLLGICIAILAMRRARAPILGAILAMAKPQYAALPALAMAAVLARRGAWRAILITGAVLLAMVLLAFALEPRAFGALTVGAGQRSSAFDRFPTSWGLAWLLAPDNWPVALAAFLAIATVACGGAVVASTEERRDEVFVTAALALGVVVTPYALTYEHALLLPALVSAVWAADNAAARPRLVLFAAVVLLSAAAWGTFLFTTGAPLGFVPLATVLLLGTAHFAAWRTRAGS